MVFRFLARPLRTAYGHCFSGVFSARTYNSESRSSVFTREASMKSEKREKKNENRVFQRAHIIRSLVPANLVSTADIIWYQEAASLSANLAHDIAVFF